MCVCVCYHYTYGVLCVVCCVLCSVCACGLLGPTASHTHTYPCQFLPPVSGTILLGPSSPHAAPPLCLFKGSIPLKLARELQRLSLMLLTTTTPRSFFQTEVQVSSANAHHQRPLLGPSFEGEARGGREPGSPTRAVRRSSSGRLMALGKIMLERWAVHFHLEAA